MKQDQNRIELRLNTAEYDECILRSNEGTFVKPGSLVIFEEDPLTARGYSNFEYSAKTKVKVTKRVVADAFGHPVLDENGDYVTPSSNADYYRDDYQFSGDGSLQHNRQAPYARTYYVSYGTYADDSSVADEVAENNIPVEETKTTPQDRFPVAVVLENALFGKALNHDAVVGAVTPVRYLTETNEVLLRAVPGKYYYGDVVYAVQTLNDGIWVASETTLGSGISAGILGGSATLGMKVGICQEDYGVTLQMCMISDTTGPEDPTGYTPANKDMGSGDDWVRWGAQAIPFHSTNERNSFYYEGSSSSRYFGGALVNLIKVRTTAFYAESEQLPIIEGIELPESVTKRYKGEVWSLDTLIPVDVDGGEVSRVVEGGGNIRNRGNYNVVVTVRKEGYQTFTGRVPVTILPQPLIIDIETNGPSWTRAADNTTDPIRLDLTAYTTGIWAGDDISVYGTTAELPGSAPGTYEGVQLFFSYSGSEKDNYYVPHENPWPKVTVTLTGVAPGPTGNDDPPEGLSVTYSSLGDTITYDGVDRPISDFFEFTGVEPGDDINYYVDGTLFGGEVPTVKVPGIYSVTITVDREGYAQFSDTLPVTINKAHVTVTGSTAQSKAYDKSTYATLNLGTVTGLVAGDDATLGYAASFASSLPGIQDVDVTYSLGGTDTGYYILDTVNETLSAEITTREFAITGTEIKEKVYDGTSAAEVVVGSVTGLIEGDDVTITGSAIFHTVTVGDYNITVHYTLTGADAGKYYAPNQTRPTRIKPKRLTISGTTAADKEYDGTTDATITPGTLSGLVGSDTVNLTATGSFPSAEVGDYEVEVSYSISGGESRNYYAPVNDAVNASITEAASTTYTYAAVANGGPTETTTEIAVNLIGDDSSLFPEYIPYENIEIGGDAVLNTDAVNCPVALGVLTIPVRMVKSFKDSYEITIKITADNQDKEVKPVPAYFMAGYWGIYPCQLGDQVTPTASQIVSSVGRRVLTGSKVSSVSCVFALNGLDWAKEVAANGVTGEDADIDESGCGYEYFVTCWDTSVGTIMNEANIPQNNAFNSFTITINGVEYSGVVSKNCDLPSGTSPFVVNLT